MSDYIVNPVKKVSEFPKGPALTDTYRRKESDAKDTDTKVDNRKKTTVCINYNNQAIDIQGPNTLKLT